MKLEETRGKINQMDAELLRVLNKRMQLVLRTKRFKEKIVDENREKQVLQNAKNNALPLVRDQFAEQLFGEIMQEAKNLQSRDLKLIGFQGEEGAYSESAVAKVFPQALAIPCLEFEDVFEEVEDGSLDCGVVPVENSIEGGVNAVNDLLIKKNLFIIGEVILPIHHCLLSLPETDYREISVVYSHPQALGQCRAFISRNNFEPRPFYDTAGAAAMLAREKPRGAAVIASELAAHKHGLEVLKQNIEDHASNTTRFVVISREKAKQQGGKCSIAFSTLHRAGALFSVLKSFSELGINLTRIESRPIRQEPGKFAFLLDFQGSESGDEVQKALQEVEKQTEWLKFLGCYKEALA